MAASSKIIPHFISASSPRDLMRKMFLTNVRDSAQHVYHIVKDGTKWVAWYDRVLDIDIKVKDNAVSVEIKEDDGTP